MGKIRISGLSEARALSHTSLYLSSSIEKITIVIVACGPSSGGGGGSNTHTNTSKIKHRILKKLSINMQKQSAGARPRCVLCVLSFSDWLYCDINSSLILNSYQNCRRPTSLMMASSPQVATRQPWALAPIMPLLEKPESAPSATALPVPPP